MKVNIEKLKEGSFANQLAFAYLTCERLYPYYVYFSLNFSFGSINIVRKAIDDIRKHLIEDVISDEEILQDFNEVSVNTPDTDDFITIHASSALDACCIVLNSLQFLLDRKFDHLVYMSRYGTDMVDRYLNSDIEADVISPKLEQAILNDPLMKREISFQNEVISFLISHPTLKGSDIDYLIDSAPDLLVLK